MSRKLKVAAPVPADPLAAYPAEFAECRVDRHRWARRAIWRLIGADVSERIRQCSTCGTRAVQTVNTRTWQRIGGTRYRYAPGYSMRGRGLVMADYRERHFSADFDAARESGRVG